MKVRGRIVAIALAATLLAGCWEQAGFGSGRGAYNAGETTITAANVASLDVAWTAPVGSAASEAIVRGGTAFVRTEGAVTALNLNTGGQRWRTEPGSSTVDALHGTSVPAILDGKLRVPATGTYGPCRLVSLNLDTGTIADNRIYSDPPDFFEPAVASWDCTTADALVAGSTVVLPWWSNLGYIEPGCPDPTVKYVRGPGLTMTDFGTPPRLWGFSRPVGFRCEGAPVAVPPAQGVSLSGDMVLYAENNLLQAYPGAYCGGGFCSTKAWEVDLIAPIAGPPVALANGDIAVARANGSVAVIDGTSHAIEWTGAVGAPLSFGLAANDTSIFAAATDGTVRAFPIGGCGSSACGPTWSATLPSGVSARPSIGGDVVYVGRSDGAVTALPAAGCGALTCPTLWTRFTGSAITGAPVISDGHVVVGSANGTVTAFALSG